MLYTIIAGPAHKHDCPDCTYIGTLRNRDASEVLDVYFHCGIHSTLIARYSSEGPDYYGCPVELLGRSETTKPQGPIDRAYALLKAVS